MCLVCAAAPYNYCNDTARLCVKKITCAASSRLLFVHHKRSFAVEPHFLHTKQQHAVAFCDKTAQQDLECIVLSSMQLQEL